MQICTISPDETFAAFHAQTNIENVLLVMSVTITFTFSNIICLFLISFDVFALSCMV